MSFRGRSLWQAPARSPNESGWNIRTGHEVRANLLPLRRMVA